MSSTNTGVSDAEVTIIFLNLNGQQNNLDSTNFSLATAKKHKAGEKLLTAPAQQGPGAIHCVVPVE